MDLEKLEAKYHEMRAKKWRFKEDKVPAMTTGFQLEIVPFIFLGRNNDPEDGYLINLEDDEDEWIIEEVTPYTDWPIDCKVLVWDDGYADEKQCRHFAGVGNYGKPRTWVNGNTSWSTDEMIAWDHAKRVEE